MTRIVLDVDRFKFDVKKGLALPAGAVVRKTGAVTVTAAGERRKLFTISTAAIDRDNDVIMQEGWDLKAYMQNPLVLWQHDAYSPPIGRTTQIGVEGGALKAEVEFVPADMPVVGELAEMVWRMCDLGFLNACSVGMRPLEYTVAKDRMTDDDWFPPVNFTKQELCEWSICTIPANPEATISREERSAEIERVKALADEALAAAAAAELARVTQRKQFRALCY